VIQFLFYALLTGGVGGGRPVVVKDTAGMRREIENVY